MFLTLMFLAAFGASDIKETWTSDVKLTLTNGRVYNFKRVYEDSIHIQNVYPSDLTDYDKRICESLNYLDDIETTLEEDLDEGKRVP